MGSYDAVSVPTSMFISQTQEKLYTCFKTTADSTNMPVIMYNNKPKTNVTIAPATVVRLARDCPNIVGVKNSTGMGTFPEVIKEGLNLQGLQVGKCLEPIGGLTVEEKEKLRTVLREMELI